MEIDILKISMFIPDNELGAYHKMNISQEFLSMPDDLKLEVLEIVNKQVELIKLRVELGLPLEGNSDTANFNTLH